MCDLVSPAGVTLMYCAIVFYLLIKPLQNYNRFRIPPNYSDNLLLLPSLFLRIALFLCKNAFFCRKICKVRLFVVSLQRINECNVNPHALNDFALVTSHRSRFSSEKQPLWCVCLLRGSYFPLIFLLSTLSASLPKSSLTMPTVF